MFNKSPILGIFSACEGAIITFC